LPARPKQILTFFFEDSYRTLRAGSSETDAVPRVAVVGPQSQALPGLSVFGRIDQFTIHFQPSGFNQLFDVPMTELTDACYDAHAVLGARFPTVEQELGSAQSFSERIRIIETRLIGLVRDPGRHDPVAKAATSLFTSHGLYRVSAVVAASGLSTRQFERRFLAQVGMPPKRYARIVRFNAVLDNKLRNPGRVWSGIALDHDYYDQMHFVRDCRAFTGASPSGFMAHLHGRPEFHPYFATADRPRRD
jgi:AraC-like DNA-binding protein